MTPFSSPLFFCFCSTVYQQPFLVLSVSTCWCWFCLCTWVSVMCETDTINIQSHTFSPELIRMFLSLVFENCNLTLKSSAVSCPFFLHWWNTYAFLFKTRVMVLLLEFFKPAASCRWVDVSAPCSVLRSCFKDVGSSLTSRSFRARGLLLFIYVCLTYQKKEVRMHVNKLIVLNTTEIFWLDPCHWSSHLDANTSDILIT